MELKKSIRISMASLLASGVLAAGFAVVSAAPAGADGAGSTLSCDITTTPGKITCTAGDLDGIKTIAVYNADARSNQFGLSNDCTTPVVAETFNVPLVFRYKVTVNDCNKPRVKTVFIVKGDGSVTPVGGAPTT